MRHQGCGERNPQTREWVQSELVSFDPGHDARTRQSKHAKRQARLGGHANRDREFVMSSAHLLVVVLMIFFELIGAGRCQLDEEAPPQHRDAAVAGTQRLPAAVGHRALADPGDDVLVDDVAGDPPAGDRVLDRAGPGR